MLDIYRVPDSVGLDEFIASQEEGHNLEVIRLGGIRFKEHIQLEKIFPEIENISHYEDNHIDSIRTKQIYEVCKTLISTANVSQEDLTILKDFCSMLEIATQNNEGIITICD